MRPVVIGLLLAAAVVSGCAPPVPGTPAAPPGPTSLPDVLDALPWTTVTDGATRTTVVLPGPANPRQTELPNADPAQQAVTATQYEAVTARSGTVQLFIMLRGPGIAFDGRREVGSVADGLKGTVTANNPVTVDGHPGVDYTITYTSRTSGQPSVVHTRFVEARDFAVRLTTRGVGKDPAEVAALHQRVAASLKVPAP